MKIYFDLKKHFDQNYITTGQFSTLQHQRALSICNGGNKLNMY